MKPDLSAAEYAISRPLGDHDRLSTYCVAGVTTSACPEPIA